MLRVAFSTIWVLDLDAAISFYTKTLGFVVIEDIELAPPAHSPRLVSLASPCQRDGPFLLLAPPPHPAAATYISAMKEQGIPAASFVVDDVRKEWEQLDRLGVVFETPADVDGGVRAVFDDTVGNLIEIVEMGGQKGGQSVALAREQA